MNERPWPVFFACWILIVFYLLELIATGNALLSQKTHILQNKMFGASNTNVLIPVLLVFLVIEILNLISAVWMLRGRSWARLLFFILCFLMIALKIWSIFVFKNTTSVMNLLISFCLLFIFIWCFYNKKARFFFHSV